MRRAVRHLTPRRAAVIVCVLTASVVRTPPGAGSTAVSIRSEQGPFPACPGPLAPARWSAPEAPTRAIAARQWFALLHKQVPAAKSPTVLLTLSADDPVTVCRIASSGPATPGLGVTADTAVIVVSKASTEEIVRVDGSAFEVYLPPGGLGEVGPGFILPERGPDWPVQPIASTGGDDAKLIDALVGRVFGGRDEVIAFGPETPDQPGRARTDRLVLGDRCGTIGLSVRIQGGRLSVITGEVEPRSCGNRSARRLLAGNPSVSSDRAGLRLVSGTDRVSVPVSTAPSLTLRTLRTYRHDATSNAVAVRVSVGRSGLRSFSGSDGCNEVTTAIAFSATRFVIDPRREQTAADCGQTHDTALVPLLANRTGTGTYTLKATTLTVSFLDRAKAVFDTAKTAGRA